MAPPRAQDAGEQPAESASFYTAPSVLTPLPEEPRPGEADDSTADSGPGPQPPVRRRQRAPSLGRTRAANHAQYISELKAHFDEVRAPAVGALLRV